MYGVDGVLQTTGDAVLQALTRDKMRARALSWDRTARQSQVAAGKQENHVHYVDSAWASAIGAVVWASIVGLVVVVAYAM